MPRSRTLGYGEGSIYQQRDGRWRGELRLGTKRRRVSGWTRGEVVAKLDELRAKSEAGLPLGSDMRLGEWLDWYLEMIETEKNPSTCANCAWAVKQLAPLRGRRLRELDVLEFEALLKDLANPGRGVAATKARGGREKPLSKSSLNRIKMILGAALHEAERRGLVARNIARLAHLLRLPTELVALLRAHRLAQRKARLASKVWEDHGLVFTNALGRPIDASNLRRIVTTYANRANVGHLSPNELRHSAASLLVANGTPLQDVSDMLGHRDIRMLAQTYRHKIRSVVDVTTDQERMLFS